MYQKLREAKPYSIFRAIPPQGPLESAGRNSGNELAPEGYCEIGGPQAKSAGCKKINAPQRRAAGTRRPRRGGDGGRGAHGERGGAQAGEPLATFCTPLVSNQL